MRSVCVSLIFAAALTGCATVSVIPGTATVETSLSEEQSEFHKTCGAFVEQAEAEHWIAPSTSLIGWAKVFVYGDKDEAQKTSYTSAIDVAGASPDTARSRILTDIQTAEASFGSVLDEALTYIESTDLNEKQLRTDVTHFEKALIAAQQSRRSFAEAVTILSGRTSRDLSDLDEALAGLDAKIDEARVTADSIANLYASQAFGQAAS